MSEAFPFQTIQDIAWPLKECRRCPRLVAWRETVSLEKRRAFREVEYWGKPVPGFGDREARLLVLGLAPGAHGSNRTGRMFTGDASGVFLFRALHRAGFASQAEATARDDGLRLRDVYISAVVKCAPPQNKPTPLELHTCQPWLEAEMAELKQLQGIVVLGKIAFDGLLSLPAFKPEQRPEWQFKHLAFYELGQGLPWLLCSYHPSRQNTQTRRLTEEMFDAVWQLASQKLI